MALAYLLVVLGTMGVVLWLWEVYYFQPLERENENDAEQEKEELR